MAWSLLINTKVYQQRFNQLRWPARVAAPRLQRPFRASPYEEEPWQVARKIRARR